MESRGLRLVHYICSISLDWNLLVVGENWLQIQFGTYFAVVYEQVGKEYVPNSRKFVYGPAEELEEGESKELMWCIEINENNLQISTTVVFVVC